MLGADVVSFSFGIRAKKYFTLGLGLGQGAVSLGFGNLLQTHKVVSIGHMVSGYRQKMKQRR